MLVCLNDAHLQTLKRSLVSYIKGAIEGNNIAFCLWTKKERFRNLQSNCSCAFVDLAGAEREKSDGDGQGAGRQEFQAGMGAVLDSLQAHRFE